ncbi:ABC transporter permease [Halosimplex aquaticum]|uniref:ABC transporter permease n=1 Tax=Halosimplex aquaticum TaxID=3026162 RepID=A0ABD5Y944_9EURY|nr:ABC transporter permease [Halosimplex aquaticum]
MSDSTDGADRRDHADALEAIPDADEATDDPVARTDGGNVGVDSPFEVVSSVEETRLDRIRKIYDTYVRAPFLIVWTDWRARIGFTIVFTYLFMGIVGPHIISPTEVGEAGALAKPFQNWDYPLGTDQMGRDLFSQVVYSTTEILKMVFSGALATVGVGTLVGAIAGYKGGWADTVLSSITDIFINLPGLPTVMVLALLLPIGNDPYVVGILLSIAAWGGLARAIRSQMLTLRSESFVEASRAMGIPNRDIIFKEIVPHLMPFVVINLTNAARRVIFSAVALYYLGILPFEKLNWGITLNQAYSSNAHVRPGALHWFLVPMIAIIVFSVGLILLGQSLDRVFNPRVRARHEKRSGDEGAASGEEDTSGESMVGGV